MYVPDRFLRAADLGRRRASTPTGSRSCSTSATGAPAVPNGSVGFRYGEQGKGAGTCALGGIEPVLTLHRPRDEAVAVDLPRFDVGDGRGRRGDAPRRAGDPGRRPAGDAPCST